MDAEATATTTGAQANLKPWPKGVSGNPSGGSKVQTAFRNACREHSDEAVQTLLTVMRNPKAMSSAKVQASRTILAYAWGAPKDGDEGDKAGLVINILKLALGNQQPTLDVTPVIQKLAPAE